MNAELGPDGKGPADARCGARTAEQGVPSLVVSVEDLEAAGERQFAFAKSPVRIGRSGLNDLPLQRPFVSSYHGLVQFDEDGARYVDVGSRNGSLVGGVRAERNVPVPLAPGAEVRIGSICLTFSRGTGGARVAAPVPREKTAFALRVASPSVALDRASVAAAVPVVRPEPVALSSAAMAAAAAAVETASLELDLQYASYRGAWEHLRAGVEAALAGLEGEARKTALDMIAARYPAVSLEPQFVKLGGVEVAPVAAPGLAASPEAARPVAMGEDLAPAAVRLLATFAESYGGDERLRESKDVEALLGRISEVLETFGRSFIELHRGYEEFGKEMGVRAVPSGGAIHRVRDPRQLLAYLLDTRGEGRDRELQRAFAEFMLHQVALLRGVAEGGRELLAQVSPEMVSSRARRGLWPTRAAAMWREFEARFHELADEESELTRVLFGKEFTRAYAAIMGERSPDRAEDDEGTPHRGARARADGVGRDAG